MEILLIYILKYWKEHLPFMEIVVLLLAASAFCWDLVIGMYDSRKELVSQPNYN
jgi:hypothetical protein